MQKPIPKEKIDKIVTQYNCSLEDAGAAYLEAEASFEETLADRLGSDTESTTANAPEVRSPKEIKEFLDKYVIGQETYKKRLAIAAAYHFATVKAKDMKADVLQGVNVKRFRKKNTLIAGPSGSGKTYCVEVLGDLLQVPVNIVDATDYTEAGYVGKSADDMIRELIQIAPGNDKREKVEFISRYGGLIFIDEMDKKAKEGSHFGADVSREGFQRAVLKLIERKQVSIEDPNSPMSHLQDMMEMQRTGKKQKKASMISTENILFILGGSFQRQHEGMEHIVKKRLANKSGRTKEDGSLTISGFQVQTPEKKKGNYRNYYKHATEDDYIRFGLIPELVGRAPIRTYVNALSKNDLVRIMTETEDSILEQYKAEFGLFGIEASFEADAISYVAEKAEEKRTGARALVSEWEAILTDFQYSLPESTLSTLTINRDLCERPQDILAKLLEKSPIFEFVDQFSKEHGITLNFTDESAEYIEEYATSHHMQVSDATQQMMAGAAALNYMNENGEFEVTKEMLTDEKYFDKLYVKWHQQQMENG